MYICTSPAISTSSRLSFESLQLKNGDGRLGNQVPKGGASTSRRDLNIHEYESTNHCMPFAFALHRKVHQYTSMDVPVTYAPTAIPQSLAVV